MICNGRFVLHSTNPLRISGTVFSSLFYSPLLLTLSGMLFSISRAGRQGQADEGQADTPPGREGDAQAGCFPFRYRPFESSTILSYAPFLPREINRPYQLLAFLPYLSS